MSKDELTEAIELYVEGWTIVDLSEHFEKSCNIVRSALEQAGVKLDPGEVS